MSFFGGLFKGIKKAVRVVSRVAPFIPGPIGMVARGARLPGLIGKGVGIVRAAAGGRPRATSMPGGAPVRQYAPPAPRRQRTATRARAQPRRRRARKLRFGSPAWRRKYMRRRA